MMLFKEITLSILLLSACSFVSAENNDNLFEKGQNLWRQISKGQCEKSKKGIKFPFWVDGEYTKSENWASLCAGLSQYSQKASKTYKEELGIVYLYRVTSGNNLNLNESKYPRLIEFIKKNNFKLKIVTAMWKPFKKPTKKSGVSLIFSCKKELSCRLVGIDDKLIF